ncbi:ATP-binding protein [Nonomuraea sp. PA05]|uniref:ATP-binding protein n=1 Tax=Nonomuraea sp. PA05 TaxID=2604466 RepID=UPI0011D412A5|nr:ATP-binding protein [Nonomuraea sp. PA05]TYB52379.1 ATP-binding protein [Nonomuraea sp. PA05]
MTMRHRSCRAGKAGATMRRIWAAARSERLLTEVVVPGDTSSVPLLRRCVTLVLTAAGHRDLERVRLVLTELLSNAVVHTRSGLPGGLVAVQVSEVGDGLVRIVVADAGALTIPQPRLSEDHEDHGRGLVLVEAQATRWGTQPGSLGTSVWAEVLTVDASPPEQAAIVPADVVWD